MERQKDKRMKVIKLIWVSLTVLVTACGNPGGADDTVAVKEVIEVQKYTYLLVENKKKEFWIAAPAMVANPGERYSYQGGMEMTDFYSKELDRTFEKVFFVDALFPVDGQTNTGMAQGIPETGHPMPGAGHTMGSAGAETTPGSSIDIEKEDVSVAHGAGVTPVADIFANPKKYNGKEIRVTGVVSKFNPAIMNRNWIHLQDGSEFEGKFDLVATSEESFKEGEQVTLEGVIATDLDFGYGYTYEVLLEQATAVR